MKRSAVAAAVAVPVLVVSAAMFTRSVSGTSLVRYPTERHHLYKRRVGQTYAFGLPRLELRSSSSIRLVGFRLIDPSPGLILERAFAYDICANKQIGEVQGNDGRLVDTFPQIQMVPIKGLVVPAGQACWAIVVEVRGDRPGVHGAEAVEIVYRQDGWLWFDRTRREVIPHSIRLHAS